MRYGSSARGLVLVLVALFAVRARAADAPDAANVVRKNGFEITVPQSFVVGDENTGTIVFFATLRDVVDQRGLPWLTDLSVEQVNKSMFAGQSLDAAIKHMANNIRNRFGSKLLDDPVVDEVSIPGCAGARLVTYRARGHSKHERHFDLVAVDGERVFVVTSVVEGYAGSEVLLPEHDEVKQLRQAVMSLRVTPPATTQTSTATPATKPAR